MIEPATPDIPAHWASVAATAEPVGGPWPVIAPPFWTGVRGVVADRRLVPARSAGGVLLGRLLLLAAIVVVVVLDWQSIVNLVSDAVLTFLLAQLIPIAVVVMIVALVGHFIPRAGGCLLVPFRLITLGAFNGAGRGTKTRDGWDLVLETASGNIPVRIAADIPLEGGEEIIVHGPAYGGRKHAWLVQGIEPTFVRMGRGIVPLVTAAILIVIGLVVLMVQIRAGR